MICIALLTSQHTYVKGAFWALILCIFHSVILNMYYTVTYQEWTLERFFVHIEKSQIFLWRDFSVCTTFDILAIGNPMMLTPLGIMGGRIRANPFVYGALGGPSLVPPWCPQTYHHILLWLGSLLLISWIITPLVNQMIFISEWKIKRWYFSLLEVYFKFYIVILWYEKNIYLIQAKV